MTAELENIINISRPKHDKLTCTDLTEFSIDTMRNVYIECLFQLKWNLLQQLYVDHQ